MDKSTERKHLIDLIEGYFSECIKSSDKYRKIFSNIKQTSYDEDAKFYLSNSEESCINFDKLKEVYFMEHNYRYRKLSETKYPGYPYTQLDEYCSNDAVAIFDDMDYFIEFKNKAVLINKNNNKKNKNNDRIKEKIKDSVLIYLDIFDEKLSYTRKNLGYILVYNPTKSEQVIDSINAMIKKYGQKEIDKFGLRANYEDFYFKRVRIMSKEAFEEFLDDRVN